MPRMKQYVSTTVGRGLSRRNMHGGNPILMGLAGAVLPQLIGPLIQPALGGITRMFTGQGTRLAGGSVYKRKKKTHRR